VSEKKEFARVEYVGVFGRWMVLSNGESRLGDFEEEGEENLICGNINFAHRKALEDFREEAAKIAEAHPDTKYASGLPCGCSYEISAAIRRMEV
jgi:hypothetical protein